MLTFLEIFSLSRKKQKIQHVQVRLCGYMYIHVYIMGSISISVSLSTYSQTKRHTMYICAHQSSVSLFLVEQESSQETEGGRVSPILRFFVFGETAEGGG